MKAWDFLPEFVKALEEQLKADDVRWGDTWLQRKKMGQEKRTEDKFREYFDAFYQLGEPIPWLKIAGGALICWIREQHPEIWKE